MLTAKRLRFGLTGAGLAAAVLLASAASATPVVAITEWMYNGDEFIELTNMSSAPVDFTGWSFADTDTLPGAVSLSGFGTVAAGESVILAEASAAAFSARWGLTTTKIIGDNMVNLARVDRIDLFDASSSLVDRLEYGDTAFPGTIRTQNISGNPTTLAFLGANNVAGWTFSQVGDGFGSYSVGSTPFIANPGKFLPPVPLPAALPLLLSGLVGFAAVRRRARERAQ